MGNSDTAIMPKQVQLPRHVVFRILQHVPLKQRMRMRLVCKLFAAEALAATDTLVLQHTNTSTARTCLNDWIDAHGSQLTSLQLEQQQYHWQLLSLQACPGLKSLQLGHSQVSLALSGNGSSLQLLSATTGLTRLALVNVAATEACAPDTLMSLTALTALKELEADASGQGVDAAYEPLLLRLPSPLIPCLTQVTHLALHHAVTELWALQQVSCLTALHSLSIDASTASAPASAAVLTQLSAQDVLRTVQPLHMLTALCLAGSCSLYWGDQQTLSRLTSLRRLELRNFRVVDPVLLGPLTGLQHLVLHFTRFAGQAGTAEVLAWLAQLNLTYLDLSGALADKHLQAPAAAYSALTASSNLQHLDLSFCCLPEKKAVWQVVFAPDTRLPQLTFLSLGWGTPQPRCKSLHNLVACCPALRKLSLTRMREVTYPYGYFEWEISAITRLTRLISLTVCVASHTIAAGVLPALTALQALILQLPAGGLHRRTLLPLTQLRQLASLVVITPRSLPLVLQNKSPEGRPPDVWRQLRDWAAGASSVANCVAVVCAAFRRVFLDNFYPVVGLTCITSIYAYYYLDTRGRALLLLGEQRYHVLEVQLPVIVLLLMFVNWYSMRRD